MFDFRLIALFCLEKRPSKPKMTMFSKNFEGALPLFPPGYTYVIDIGWPECKIY